MTKDNDTITPGPERPGSPPGPEDSSAANAEERYRELRHFSLSDRVAYRQVVSEDRWLSDEQRHAAGIARDAGLTYLTSLRIAMATGTNERVRADRDGRDFPVTFNPWMMLRKVPRLNLAHADQMAELLKLEELLGFPFETPDRDEAAFLKAFDSVLDKPWNQGSTHADAWQVEREFERILGTRRNVTEAMVSLQEAGVIRLFWPEMPGRNGKMRTCLRITTKDMYNAEFVIAKRALSAGSQFTIPELPSGLDSQQQDACAAAFTSSVSVITAPPGYGKTRAVAGIINAALPAGIPVIAAAFMGRAAVRVRDELSKLGINPEGLFKGPGTLHSIFRLGWGQGSGSGHRNRLEFPETGILIIDEASMVSTALLAQVIRKLPEGWNVVLAGDAGQLPAIDPGNVLADLIQCGEVPVTELSTCYRTANPDLTEAIKSVSKGTVPASSAHVKMLRAGEDRGRIAQIIGTAVLKAAGEAGCDPRDVFVVTAQNGSTKPAKPILTGDLNRSLKAVLNPTASGPWENIATGDRVYAAGGNAAHRIPAGNGEYIQRASTGELGTVLSATRNKVSVAWDGREDEPQDYFDDEIAGDDSLLRLAYAVTVHKVQGGEKPAVIFVADSLSAQSMLTRTLAYTAVSRAKNLAVVIDIAGGFGKAVTNAGNERQTLLPRMLAGDLS